MSKTKDVPVYLFTGFLEAGKTKFIQETLEDRRFCNGERTLLLVCEEGEEEYDPQPYPHKDVFLEVIDQEQITKAELEAIAEVCCRHNIYVIADEIYCNLVYDNNEFVSFASLGEDVKERTILVNGVSKSYAMTGWRLGYSASNPQLAKVMANYLSHSTSAPSTISQQAAITALTGPQEDMQVMKQAFEQRRDHLVERMNQIEGVSCIKPEGAFYVMMNMKGFLGKTMYGKVIESAEDFAQLFLEKGLVATVPCTAFAAPGFVRWSYATSLTEIDKGLDRLEAFIKNA